MRNRAIAILIALCAAVYVPVVAMVYEIYNDPMTIKKMLLAGAGIGFAMAALALLAGLVLRIPVLRERWKRNPGWALALALVCAGLLLGGNSLGLCDSSTHSNGDTVSGLRLDVALASYFGLIFALANWPTRRRRKPKPEGEVKPRPADFIPASVSGAKPPPASQDAPLQP